MLLLINIYGFINGSNKMKEIDEQTFEGGITKKELVSKFAHYEEMCKVIVSVRMPDTEELIFMPIDSINYNKDNDEIEIDCLWKDRL